MNKIITWHLAQINIARMTGTDITDPGMKSFMDQLDEVNEIAEKSKGFVWRLKDENNNTTSLQAFDDKQIIVNMSVWETLDDLQAFVYKGRHLEVLKNRRDWFVKFGQAFMVLWYIPAGHIPSITEARERLSYLQQYGSTAYAFDFKLAYPQPGT